jgi:hypothetical protein
MTPAHFRLDPFPGEDTLARIEIAGSIGRSGNDLSLSYFLSGDVSQVAIPTLSNPPVRKDGLWNHTCFELFMAPKGSRGYWEFNISPSGDWNVYRFRDYRQGMREEQAFAALPFRVSRKADCLSLFLECELAGIVGNHETLEIAISAVVRTSDGQVSHRALKHCGAKPDFHRRDGFVMEL